MTGSIVRDEGTEQKLSGALPGIVGVDGREETGTDMQEAGAWRVARVAFVERLGELKLHARVRHWPVRCYSTCKYQPKHENNRLSHNCESPRNVLVTLQRS